MWGKRYPSARGDCVADLVIARSFRARHEDMVYLPFSSAVPREGRKLVLLPGLSLLFIELHQPLRRLSDRKPAQVG